MYNLFLSNYTNKIDQKGRVSLPSSFRDVINKEMQNKFIIYKSILKQCLEGANLSYISRLDESISNMDPFSEEKDAFATTIFSDSVAIEFDQDGRIVIPKSYLQYANISDNSIFVGKGKTFEIWNPDLFTLYSKQCREFAIKNAKMLKWNG